MFVHLDNKTKLIDALNNYPEYKSVILFKNVQSAKTADVLELIESTYKKSATIFISDKNSSLAEQTNARARKRGWTVTNFRDDLNKLFKSIITGVGKKQIAHFMMEINNLQMLEDFFQMREDIPVTVIIDEADKSKNTESAKSKKTREEEEEFDLDEDETEPEIFPPVTKLLFKIKNHVKARQDSLNVFVSATPQGILFSEKDDWLVFYKDPFDNYTGIGLDHPANIKVVNCIRANYCKTKYRWTDSIENIKSNTFIEPVQRCLKSFEDLESRDETIKQIMLFSFENRKALQYRLSDFCENNISPEKKDSIDIIVFNGDTRDKNESLADMIKSSNKKKIVIIAGFMASRGVSFTDFSDSDNKFELVVQMHYTKPDYPLNSALQLLRVSGPARKTVSRPLYICNSVGYKDITTNFLESYRIIKQVAEEKEVIPMEKYDWSRPLCQSYNFRYWKRGSYKTAVFISPNLDDHLPII